MPATSPAATTTLAQTTAVPTPTIIPNWKYLGCYHDHEGVYRGADRLLGNATVTYSNMDAPGCEEYCSGGAVGAPYQYFGLESGTECWCGSNLNLDENNFISNEADCDSACGGEAKQVCGGAWYINVYSASATQTRATVPATATSSTSVGGGSVGTRSAAPSSTASAHPSASSGASAGTIAAAVIAGVLGFALILVGVLWALKRRSGRNRAELAGTSQAQTPLSYAPVSQHGDQAYAKHQQPSGYSPAFLDSRPINELPTQQARV